MDKGWNTRVFFLQFKTRDLERCTLFSNWLIYKRRRIVESLGLLVEKKLQGILNGSFKKEDPRKASIS